MLLEHGEPTGKPGRPRVKGEKIDFKNIDKSKVTILDTDKSNEQVYALKAWCKSLHRKISLVIHILPKGGHRLYFSTDENMSGRDVMEYYCTRFQIEFCFRDAKQFVELTDCQARDTRKLDFAFNSSFTAVNAAKIMCSEYNLSIGRLKALMINAYYAQRIIDVFENNPNKLIMDRAMLYDSVKRVALFANQISNQVVFRLKDNELFISAEDTDMATLAKEKLNCNYSGDELEIGFNANFLMEMLNNIDTELLLMEMSTPDRAGIIFPYKEEEEESNESILMLVMPVMLVK